MIALQMPGQSRTSQAKSGFVWFSCFPGVAHLCLFSFIGLGSVASPANAENVSAIHSTQVTSYSESTLQGATGDGNQEEAAANNGDLPALLERWSPGPQRAGNGPTMPRELPGVRSWQIHTFLHRLNNSNPTAMRACLSWDDRYLAIVMSSLVAIYEVETRRLVHIFHCEVEGNSYQNVSWHPKGTLVALARSGGVIELRSLETGGTVEIPGLPNQLTIMEWSPDGRWLACAAQKAVLLYSEDGLEERKTNLHARNIIDLTWSPDSQYLASTDGSAIRRWSMAEDKSTELTAESGVHMLCFSPESKEVAAYSQATHEIWIQNLRGNVLDRWKDPHTVSCVDLSWHPTKDYVLTAAVRKGGNAWTRNGERLFNKVPYGGPYQGAFWSRDGERIFYIDREHIDSATLDETQLPRFGLPAVHSVDWSPDGRMMALGMYAGEIRIIDNSGKRQQVVQGGWGRATRVRFSPDGKMIAVLPLGRPDLRIYTTEGAVVCDIEGHDRPITDFAWAPDSIRLATTGQDKTMRIWSMSGKQVRRIDHATGCTSVAWRTDAPMVASVDSQGTVKIWDLESGSKFSLRAGAPHYIAWRPQHGQLSVGPGQSWVAGNGEIVAVPPQETKGPQRTNAVLRWSQSGGKLLWNDAESLHVSQPADDLTQHVDTARQVPGFNSPQLKDAAWNADGTYFVAVVGPTLRLYDAETLEEKAIYLPLLDGNMLMVSPAGAILNGDTADFENLIYYSVEWEDQSVDVFTPLEFYEQFGLSN